MKSSEFLDYNFFSMVDIFTGADENASNSSTEEQKKFSGVYASAKERVGSFKERVGSFLGRRWFGRRADDPSGPEGEGPLRREWNEGYGRVKNVMWAVVLAVSAATAWAVAAETSLPVSRMTSKALHAGGYEDPTVYDQYMSAQDKNSQLNMENMSLKELATQAELERVRLQRAADELQKDKSQLQTKNETLAKKNKALAHKVVRLQDSQKSKAKLTHKAKSKSRMASKVEKWKVGQKFKAEKQKVTEKQKVVDSRLKELFKLRGWKPALKHEWLPHKIAALPQWAEGLKELIKYGKKQDRSMKIIGEKIAQLEACPIKPIAQKVHVKAKVTAKSKVSASSKTVPKPKKRGDVVYKGGVKHSVVPANPQQSLDPKNIKPQEGVLSTPSVPPLSAYERKTAPDMSNIFNFSPVGSGELDQLHGAKGVSPTNTVSVITPDGSFNVPMGGGYKNPEQGGETWIAALLSPLSAKVPKSASPKPSPAPVTAVKKAPAKSSAAPRVEKGSGLTPRTLTDENLQKFLDGVNTKLGKLDKKDSLHGSKATIKKVTVDGMVAHRIILKRGDTQLGTFTLKSEEAGKKRSNTGAHIHDYKQNYKIIASKSNFINWAHRAEEKYKKNAEKKKNHK